MPLPELPTDLSKELKCIRIWPWPIAPDELRRYSTLGGDEDGIAWIPKELVDDFLYLVDKAWSHDERPNRFEFQEGLLVIWGHS